MVVHVSSSRNPAIERDRDRLVSSRSRKCKCRPRSKPLWGLPVTYAVLSYNGLHSIPALQPQGVVFVLIGSKDPLLVLCKPLALWSWLRILFGAWHLTFSLA